MKKILNSDRIVALVCIAFSAAVFVESGTWPTSKLDVIGPSTYPRLLAFLIAVPAMYLFVTSKDAKAPKKGHIRDFGYLIGVIAAYLVLMPLIGFILSTILFISALTLYFGQGDIKARAKSGIPFAILWSIGMYVFFGKLLKVLLPSIIL